MNSKIDQAIDLGIGAGLMYFFDPDQGEHRRQQILDQAKDRLDQAAEAAVQTAKRARENVTHAGQQARDAALQAGQQTREAALEAVQEARDSALQAGQQARDRALQAASDARDRAASAGQHAGAQVVQSTARTGRRARTRVEEVVPAAKALLLEKLAADERVMERARATLIKSKFFAPTTRRTFMPWGLLALLGGAALGAGLMFMLDPGIGGRRRAFVHERFGYARRQTTQTIARAGAQVRDRATSLGARQQAAAELPADLILSERVRAHLSSVASHPSSIVVTTRDGEVVLSGLCLSSEIDQVLATVSALPGVQSVANRLDVRRTVDQIPGLEGKNNR